jgi:hypothetical protein
MDTFLIYSNFVVSRKISDEYYLKTSSFLTTFDQYLSGIDYFNLPSETSFYHGI